eukprot:PhF_6_TR35129/c0_g1_i1/m.51211
MTNTPTLPPSRGAEYSSFQLAIASTLQKIANRYATTTPNDIDPAVKFLHGDSAPSIDLGNYITRMCKYLRCSPECLLMAVAYIDRLMHNPRYTNCLITPTSVHRLFFISVLAALKFHDDSCFGMTYYAGVCGVSVQHLCSLELSFLKLVDYRLTVHLKEYCTVLKVLMASPHFQRTEGDNTPLLDTFVAMALSKRKSVQSMRGGPVAGEPVQPLISEVTDTLGETPVSPEHRRSS